MDLFTFTATDAESSCANDDFQFNRVWWWLSFIAATIFFLYVLLDYIVNKKHRHNPSLLMVMRCSFDFLAVVVVLYAIDSDQISCAVCDSNVYPLLV